GGKAVELLLLERTQVLGADLRIRLDLFPGQLAAFARLAQSGTDFKHGYPTGIRRPRGISLLRASLEASPGRVAVALAHASGEPGRASQKQHDRQRGQDALTEVVVAGVDEHDPERREAGAESADPGPEAEPEKDRDHEREQDEAAGHVLREQHAGALAER